jgi:FMN phosphatase YigB (HAD superfamily)
MTVKVLSDFDGVWTDQAFEARNVQLFLIAEAARLAEIAADRAQQHFERFERIVKANPERFGWAPDGRITAYVDEDPFCDANSIAQYIDQTAMDADTRPYKAAILAAGYKSITAFADHCFMSATTSFRTQHPPALVPGAKQMFAELVGAGAEVVVVSNSPPEKITGWFRDIGVDAGDGRANALRVRGSAGKFVLGATDASIEVARRRIFTDRPKYRRILEDERPDIVIGDVFSLDLALPHVMRRAREAGAPSELVLRRHPHTPRWVLDTRAEGAIDTLVEQVGDLVASVERLAHSRR